MSKTIALAGVAAPVVFLGGAGVLSWAERDFMEHDLGWDVWPSGLALGPVGWGQVAVFLAFSALLVVFSVHLVGVPAPTRPARGGALVLAVGSLVSVLLAFRTDPPGADVTWHGVLHAVGYVVMMLALLVGMAMTYPSRIRRSTAQQWALAPLALLLPLGALLMPTPTASANYFFFAVPFTLLAALALRAVRDDLAPSAAPTPPGPA